MLRKWRENRKIERKLNPELKRLAALTRVSQAALLALGIYSGWVGVAVSVAGAAVLEVLWGQLLRTSRLHREEGMLLDRERAETESVFRDIRAQRHDFLAHAGALQYMLEEERTGEAKAYLGKLLGEYDRVNEGLRGEKAHLSALLLRARQRADAAGIRMNLDLVRPLSELPLSATDQSKLVANVLSNALEAAEASCAKEPFVKLTSLIGGGLYVLEADNSTVPLEQGLADRLFRAYGTSTKGGTHRGVGTFIIASIVESGNGHLEFSAIRDRFSLKVKLPVIK